MSIHNLVKLYPLALKKNEQKLKSDINILIKGRNSVAKLRKIARNNSNIDLVNIDVYTKFGKILHFLNKCFPIYVRGKR